MKRIIFFLLFLITVQNYFAFQIKGDVKSWTKSDFIGFDKIGDKTQKYGDISSLFAKTENDTLFIRLTFDDMNIKKHNTMIEDNFSNQNVSIKILLTKNNKEIFEKNFNISQKKVSSKDYTLIRTPQYNLLEMAVKSNISLNDLTFDITVYFNGKPSDNIKKSTKQRDSGGNCAFVHHGNQGLTYTEVFYGQYPQDTSGFDEVLQVHQATGIPGNFHMSGTLMPAAEWHNPEFNNWIRQGVADGWIAMLTSALGQHIMPFVNNDMNNWSVKIETDMVRHFYNYNAKVAWVPERVWLSPDQYPNAGVIDWPGDNWTQYGVQAVVLDDWPHLNGANNEKIHWMNNNSGINLRVIPIDNDFVGKVHYDRDGAKNLIWNTGQYQIAVYGTDWEVAAEMNENHNTDRLDNYENIIWWCHDNYPAVNVWKLDNAINNPDFNGSGVDIANGTYGILGGNEGYGGSNNSWYTTWASTPSHSDYHNPKWNYGYIWNDAYNNLSTAPDNSLSQLGWYTLMINLHETGWQEGGNVACWEHRYSSHIKNSNVYTEASRWAQGQYTEPNAAYFSDIDHDGGDELVMYNDKIFAVFEGIGGKINWLFYKDGYGNAYSVVSSDVAYWAETDGDYNENNYNHFAALSDVNPNQQNAVYDISIQQTTGQTVQATLSQWGVKKTIRLEEGKNYLDVIYDFFGSTGYIKSGFSPDLLDLIWSGKSHLQRLYGEYAKYVGWRNSSSGASVAYVLGSAGGSHNGEFEGTLVKGDEIYGTGLFSFRLFAGYTSSPYGTGVSELNQLADSTVDLLGPRVESAIFLNSNILQIKFNEIVTQETAENLDNYSFSGYATTVTPISAKLTGGKVVILKTNRAISPTETGSIAINNVKDIAGNITDTDYNTISNIPFIDSSKIPHLVGNFNGWDVSNHSYDFNIDENGLWKVTISLNSGNYEYKVSESESWNGNDWPFNNQTFSLSSNQTVTFYANAGVNIGEKSGDEFVFHSKNSPCVIGDFLSELGGTDWDETSNITQMHDDGLNGDQTANDGVFSYKNLIPPGNYEFKIVLNNNWDQNTSNTNFNFDSDGIQQTLFTYDMSQNSTTVSQLTIFEPPTNLNAQMYGQTVILNWTPPSSKSLSYYEIYKNNSLIGTSTDTLFTDSNIIDQENYSYKVRAVYQNPDGESDFSNTVSIQALFQHNITSVNFLDKTQSTYTNFYNNEVLPYGSNINIEAKIIEADTYSNSDYSVTLHYKIDSENWTTKEFSWYSNEDSISYWRVSLLHNTEIYNGDSLTFYITAADYTQNIITDNNNSDNYNVSIEGIAQPVSVKFTLNLGGLSADSVAIMGSQQPLSWTIGSNILQQDSLNYIFSKTVTFPESSNDTIQYKYGRYYNFEWHWEDLQNNRIAIIDDSDSTQTLPIDNWNNYSFPDLYSCSFKDSTESDFTNFKNTNQLLPGSNIQIETEIDGCDPDAISDFNCTLIYSKNGQNFTEKQFYWYSNDTENNKSYWRVILENTNDISNGDSLAFYIQASDYNGPTVVDDNFQNYYYVKILNNGITNEQTVDFSLNLGSVQADSLAIFGNSYPLSWDTPIYLTDENSDKIYNTTLIFPQGTPYNILYKYKKYIHNEWFWETIDNRNLLIKDNGSPNQTNDNWNNYNIVELTSVTFLSDSLSYYTNFNPGEVTNNDTIKFEIKLNAADYDAVSGLNAILHYKTTDWQTTNFQWHSNDENSSYWQTALDKDDINADSLTFYISATDYNGPTCYDNNSGSNYKIYFENQYTDSPVTVTFSLDLVSETADSVAIMGNVYPLSWFSYQNKLNYINNLYSIEITFPAGSEKSVQYKYKIFKNNIWQWETSDNRNFEIEDNSAQQNLPIDYWNDGSLSQISGIAFLDNQSSSYTNFANNDTLSTGSSLYFETKISGVDINANSQFNILLYYTTNDSLWNVKPLSWYSNDTQNNFSYWRTSLENGNQINNGDNLKFYLKASDYTQNTYIDNNNGNFYYVSISNSGISRDVYVTFSLNTGAFYPDSVSVQGNTQPLTWSIGKTILNDDDNNRIYTKTILFNNGSNKTIEYKYGAYYSNAWHWENFSDNRILLINDEDSIFLAPIDFWDKSSVADISGVHFLEKSYLSQYTNFDNNDCLSDADTLKFEVEVLGADVNSNSGFVITLYYSTDSVNWLSKQFGWYSNLISKDNRSYWRLALIKNTDFFYGDEINFYITAIDYNGPEFFDRTSSNPYLVSIGKPAVPTNVTIRKTENGFLISWDEVIGATYNIYKSENAFDGFYLWQTGLDSTSVIDTTNTEKSFYFIKSVK